MKILVDENLSWRLIPKLKEIFPEIIHLTDTPLLLGSNDYEIWNYAKANSYHILTQDSDFYRILEEKDFPPKIILIHAWNKKNQEILDTIFFHKDKIFELLQTDYSGIIEIYL